VSTLTVARDDFTNTRRSYVVLGVVGVFSALVALILGADSGHHADAYRALFDVTFFSFFVLPIIIAPLTYLTIAGDRDGGAIKYAMGLPNTRSQYVLGKLLSRLSVGLAAVVVGTLVGFAVSLVTYANTPDPARFAAFAGVTLLFAFSFVGLYVGISAATTTRSRAMLGAFGAYFVLVPFWAGFLPVISLPGLIGAAADLLGVHVSQATQNLIRALSPGLSYLLSTEIIYEGVVDTYPRLAQQFGQAGAGSSGGGGGRYPFAGELWFNALVMLGWGALSTVFGYLSFRRSELG
jgi:ABC-2 type transport system permease protein